MPPVGVRVDRSLLGDTLRTLRARRGMTVRDLAAVAGVSYQYVSALENGVRSANVTLDTLARILDAVGAHLEVATPGDEPEGVREACAELRAMTPDDRRRAVRVLAALRRVRPRTADALLVALEGAAKDQEPR